MPDINQLPRTSPEAEGIPSAAVLAFLDAVEQHTHPLDALHGFLLVRHGRVAAEGWWAPYGPQVPHSLYSLSKSFTSTAIGLAVAEGLLTPDDPVLKFFPEDAPAEPSANLQAMRVRHLLTMNTGHEADTTDHVFGAPHHNWPRAFLALPVERAPGSWFVYNTAATYMLSAILTRLTGQTLLDYLRPRLFEPLGIANPSWETDPRGINLGGTGLHITTEDIARFGQLYLQQGLWQGRRIVPEAWIVEATRAHSDNSNTQATADWTAGYGYQFWRCQHNAYRGDGAFGQYCIVMPEQDAVLAINSGVRDMQAVLDKVWEHLLPAMQRDALPANPADYAALCDRLGSLALAPPADGAGDPTASAAWSGKTHRLESNPLGWESVSLHVDGDGATLHVRDSRGAHALAIGSGAWRRGSTSLRPAGNRPIDSGPSGGEPVAAAGGWTAAGAYEVRICYYTGVYCSVLRLHFAGSDLHLEIEPNVSWQPVETIEIVGRLSD